MELYKPLGATPFFVTPSAGVTRRSLDVIRDDAVIATYGQTVGLVGLGVGMNLGRESDLRVGAYFGRLDAEPRVGDPGLPSLEGKESLAEATWRFNGQDSPVIPSFGATGFASLKYVIDGPEFNPPLSTQRSSVGLTQLTGEMNTFRSLGERNRLFVLAGGGTSFDQDPLPTDQYELGLPFHLGAYNVGELRGDHYYVVSGGYLRQLGRLPDFMGGGVFAGGWLETGDTFDVAHDATFRTNVSGGVILDTLIGPVFVAGSAGFDGRWRTYFGVGRLFGRMR
jgi:NTE family protein